MTYIFLKGIRSERKHIKKWMITLKSKLDVSYLSLTLSFQINHHHVYNGSKVGESFHDMHMGAIFICLSVELQKHKIILCETFTCARHLVLNSISCNQQIPSQGYEAKWLDRFTLYRNLQCNYLNRGTWNEIMRDYHTGFLKTKDSQVF